MQQKAQRLLVPAQSVSSRAFQAKTSCFLLLMDGPKVKVVVEMEVIALHQKLAVHPQQQDPLVLARSVQKH
jgi:hypothetical protein